MNVQTGTQAIDRAAQLLVLVLDGGQEWTVSELATGASLPKSTTSRLVRALERAGLVSRDEASGALRPGPAVVRWAWSESAWAGLAALARPHLERLAEASGETANLGIPTPQGVEQISQVDSRFLLGATNWIGRVGPHYHASALGKVFLAWQAASLAPGPLSEVTPRTITDRDRLAEELEHVRVRGYSITDEELEPGLVALAAPLRARDGSAFAGLSVSGPKVRMTPERLPIIGAQLCEEALLLSTRLGFDRPVEGAA